MKTNLATYVTAQIGSSSSEADTSLISDLRNLAKKKTNGSDKAMSFTVNEILRLAQSTTLRDAAAVAATSVGDRETPSIIENLLRRREIAPEAGTLLYALGRLTGRLSPDAIINIVEFGRFEARAELMLLLEDGLIQHDDDVVWVAMQAKLDDIAAGSDMEAARAAVDVSELLKEVVRT